MGLDYGRRRIGVATSDPTGTIASPRTVVANSGDPVRPPEALLELLRELDPVAVVVGVPFELDGSEGEMAREVRSFAEALEESTGLSVREWDERLTTEAARRALLETGASRRARRRKETTDMMAATLLLRAYLASDRSGPQRAERDGATGAAPPEKGEERE